MADSGSGSTVSEIPLDRNATACALLKEEPGHSERFEWSLRCPTLLRAKPSKGGDAEPRDYRRRPRDAAMSAEPPAQRPSRLRSAMHGGLQRATVRWDPMADTEPPKGCTHPFADRSRVLDFDAAASRNRSRRLACGISDVHDPLVEPLGGAPRDEGFGARECTPTPLRSLPGSTGGSTSTPLPPRTPLHGVPKARSP